MGLLLDRFTACHHVLSADHGETVPARWFIQEGLIFARLQDVTAYFQSVMSQAYNNSGITGTLTWNITSTTGVAVWGLSVARYQPSVTLITAPPSTVFGPETVVAPTVSGGSGIYRSTTFVIPPSASVPHVGEFYRLRLRHLGTDPRRTVNADPIMYAIALTNTT